MGQSIEGVLDQSDTARQLASDVLGKPVGGDSAVAALLTQFLSKADDASKARLTSMLSSKAPGAAKT